MEIRDSPGTAGGRGKWLRATIPGVLLFLAGMTLFFNADQIPGDLGDSRFNMFVLEHGYRWLIGLDASFWSAPFFYPAPNVIALSDNHLGGVPIYSAFRLLRCRRETAFQLWLVSIFSLNYFVTWIVLRSSCASILSLARDAASGRESARRAGTCAIHRRAAISCNSNLRVSIPEEEAECT